MSGDEYAACSLCGRKAKDVTFDYIGPDPNDMDGERWDYLCGADQGCSIAREKE